MADELKIVRDWLLKLPDLDLEDIVADGGVTSGMVVQQEAALMARKLSAILARAQGPGPVEAVAARPTHYDVRVDTYSDEITRIPSHRVTPVYAATPTREPGNQGSSQGCGTGHSGEQLEPAVGATAALAPEPTAWRYEFSAHRQEDGFMDGASVWHVGYSATPPSFEVRNLTPLYARLSGSDHA